MNAALLLIISKPSLRVKLILLEKQTVSGILSLLTHLIGFKELYLPESSISTLPKNHLIPSIIYQKCVRLFSVEGSPMISSDSLKHLIMYILVLTLHVDKYKTDPEDIAKDLRMSKSDLRTYYEELGCIFVYEESIVLATLQVPLKFPRIFPPDTVVKTKEGMIHDHDLEEELLEFPHSFFRCFGILPHKRF